MMLALALAAPDGQLLQIGNAPFNEGEEIAGIRRRALSLLIHADVNRRAMRANVSWIVGMQLAAPIAAGNKPRTLLDGDRGVEGGVMAFGIGLCPSDDLTVEDDV